MTPEEQNAFAAKIIDEIRAKERAALAGPECAPGAHDVRLRAGNWHECETCRRSMFRDEAAPGGFVVTHSCWCECRDCRARWPGPCPDAPRLAIEEISDGSLITYAPPGEKPEGWRVTGFYGAPVAGEDTFDALRHYGRNYLPVPHERAELVSLVGVCERIVRLDAFLAYATIRGHMRDHYPNWPELGS